MSANAPPPTATAAADAATAVTAGVVDPVAPVTAEAEANAAPAVASAAPVTAASRPARPCWSMIVAGYVLTALGVALIPIAPKLKSPLVARCVLILCMTALTAGAGAVVWGFVRDALKRRG